MKKNYSAERMNKICFYRNGYIRSAGACPARCPRSLSNSNPLFKNIVFNSKYVVNNPVSPKYRKISKENFTGLGGINSNVFSELCELKKTLSLRR